MRPNNGSQEIEIKLKVHSAAHARALLEGCGFVPIHERAFETNEILDTGDGTLAGTRRLLRLREFRGTTILTFKGEPEPGPHKSRLELETTVGDGAVTLEIFNRLGYEMKFRYEKYRTTYARTGEQGHAVLDETPIGVFLELEGEPAWIDDTAAALGFQPCDYILPSYGSLYREYCQTRGIPMRHMVFAAED